jgi:proteic killer suppression protein
VFNASALHISQIVIFSVYEHIDSVYISAVIQSFRCKETEKVWNEQYSRKLPTQIQQKGLEKLALLDAASILEDLLVPPGNRLEGLRGDRKGQHSIRINQQWRICFVWRDGHAHNVQIVDYH